MAQFGMFFIFLSVLHYAAAIVATVLISLKAGQFVPAALQGLLFHHVLLLVGLILARDEVKNAGYHPVTIFKTALAYSLNSVPFLLVLSAVIFVVNLVGQRRVDLVEIIYCVILLSIFLHYRNKPGY